jgi:serine/threonine protein kinase
MPSDLAVDELLLQRLPLPLAQLYRRVLNAKTAQDRHHHAFYLAEATLKLAASLRIGIVLSAGLEPTSPLARTFEQLCLPSIGNWVGFLRDSTEYLRQRRDSALLPLADCHDALLRHESLPAVREFAARAARTDDTSDSAPLTPEQARDASRQGILGFFNLIAAYRNQVFGHGAQRVPAFYDDLGPLLQNAVVEVLGHECLFGGLTLAVARWTGDPSGPTGRLVWHRLRGVAGVLLRGEADDSELASINFRNRPMTGHLYFIAPGVRVLLRPLVVYVEDRSERERVGFLNRTVTRRKEGNAFEEVRRCEYLDYATGDQLREIDARQELTRLLARLRGQSANLSDVDRVVGNTQAEPAEQAGPVPLGGALGDFELEGELGRGGMGVVFRARQRSLNRPVALKVLPSGLAADPIALARFRREIAALARCDHPNLVKILTSGSDGDRHYYAMELLEGTNLGDLWTVLSTWGKQVTRPLREGVLPAALSSSTELAERRRNADSAPDNEPVEGLPELKKIPPLQTPLPSTGRDLPTRMGELFIGAAEALVHLHERGILHRDIKPANLMLTADGQRLVLMDLGLARMEEEGADRLTRTRQFLGTLRYASPEQVTTVGALDARSDIYSFGAAMWELLALEPLYGADDKLPSPELIRRIQYDEPGRIRKFRPETSPELEAIVLKCLEKDPRRRYSSAHELVDDLGRWQRGEDVHAHRQTPWYRFRRFVIRRRLPLAGVGAGLLLLLITFLALADAGYRLPGADTVRQLLDRREASLFRPAPAEDQIYHYASQLRRRLAAKLNEQSSVYPGWWDGKIPPRDQPYYESWTQGQATTALLSCPETDSATRKLLAANLLEIFEAPHDSHVKKVKEFEPGYGWLLYPDEVSSREYPSGFGTAWILPALARAVSTPDLDPGLRDRLMHWLDKLEETLDDYRTKEAGRDGPAWRLFADQFDKSKPNAYVTAVVLLGLLDLKEAGLGWHGSSSRLDDLIHAAVNWEIDQFDGRGWECRGPVADNEFNDGLTLQVFSLLLRAEAEAGAVLPDSIIAQVPRHLADCSTRPADYSSQIGIFSEPFRYNGMDYPKEVRVVRFQWYPWAVETASRWLTRAHRVGAPHDEIVRSRRVLGHLILTIGPQVVSNVSTGYTYIAAETLLGLAAVPGNGS